MVEVHRGVLKLIDGKSPIDGEQMLWTEHGNIGLVEIPTFTFVERPKACNILCLCPFLFSMSTTESKYRLSVLRSIFGPHARLTQGC